MIKVSKILGGLGWKVLTIKIRKTKSSVSIVLVYVLNIQISL